MAIAVAQRRTGSSATTSVSATSWTTPAAGSVLLAQVWSNSGSTPGGPSGFTMITGSIDGPAAHTIVTYGKIATGSESSLTATDGSATLMEIFAVEITGARNDTIANAIDKIVIGTNTTTGTSKSSNSTGALSQANEYALASIGFGGTVTAQAMGGGFTIRKDSSNTNRSAAGDVIVAATTALTASFTWGTSRTTAITLVTVKEDVPLVPNKSDNITVTESVAPTLAHNAGVKPEIQKKSGVVLI